MGADTMPSRQCSDEDPWGEQLPRDSYPKDSAVGHANNAYSLFPGNLQIDMQDYERTELFRRAREWIDTVFFPQHCAHDRGCRHCYMHTSPHVENAIRSLFDDTPLDQAELDMILRVVCFMRPKTWVGTYYIMIRRHSEDPVAFGLLILIMESLQRAFARKGIRTRWWFHLDEKNGRYEHAHAWIKLDGYDTRFTEMEWRWVSDTRRAHGPASLPVLEGFRDIYTGKVAKKNANGPWDGDTVYAMGTRFSQMSPLSDDIGTSAHVVADSFTQYLEPINFEWGRTVQVFAWGLPDRTCFCHAPIDSRYGPRDLLVVNGEMEE